MSVLLDLLDVFRSGTSFYMHDYVSKLPDSKIKTVYIKLFQELISDALEGAKSKKIDRLKPVLAKEIEILAQYSPIVAYKLRGIEETINDVKSNSEDAKKTIVTLGGQVEDFNSKHILIKSIKHAEKTIRWQILITAIKYDFFGVPIYLMQFGIDHLEKMRRCWEMKKEWHARVNAVVKKSE